MLRIPRRQFLHLAVGAAALPTIPRFAFAQAYPTRPITMVVPFAAGGPTDIVGRLLAERMRAAPPSPDRPARSSPPNSTWQSHPWGCPWGPTTQPRTKGTFRAIPPDLMRDFEPVALISQSLGMVITAKKTVPANDLNELIAWLKANPDRVSFGTAGVGSPQHVAAVLFRNLTDTRFQFVHYRGVASAEQDLVAGQIDLMFDSPATSLPQLRAGSIKAYAVTAKSRLAVAPDIPTVDEAGLPGMYLSFWVALWAPKGSPKDVIARLNLAARSALADPATAARLAISKLRKRSAHCRRPTSRNGGRSSGRPASRPSNHRLSIQWLPCVHRTLN